MSDRDSVEQRVARLARDLIETIGALERAHARVVQETTEALASVAGEHLAEELRDVIRLYTEVVDEVSRDVWRVVDDLARLDLDLATAGIR